MELQKSNSVTFEAQVFQAKHDIVFESDMGFLERT